MKLLNQVYIRIGLKKDILAGSIYAVGIEDTIMVKRIEKRQTGSQKRQ